MDSKHNHYCQEIPHSRRGCYCWEGDRQQLLEMRIGNMEKKMDAGTMKDYIEDLIQQVNTLEAQFHKLNEVIVQLQQQRDQYRALYEATQK
jgi:predicted  nucleic acid-binding Zn-ribbon protein